MIIALLNLLSKGLGRLVIAVILLSCLSMLVVYEIFTVIKASKNKTIYEENNVITDINDISLFKKLVFRVFDKYWKDNILDGFYVYEISIRYGRS